MERRQFLKASLLVPVMGLAAQKPNYSINDKHIKDGVDDSIIIHRDEKASIEELMLLKSINKKLIDARRIVGYGKYNLLSFDECLYYLRNYSPLGGFSKKEIEKIEELFSKNAKLYGFFGQKVTASLTTTINKKETMKIPYTGHYLFKGDATKLYDKLKKEVGDSVILTSGIRGVIKQTQLFLTKVMKTHGNLSLASRSLAPPGYSYHGVGDFDVGKVGFGYKNFTQDFAKTDEYKRLMDLGYIQIRYTKNNPYGVRYEPWHVKVVS